MKKLCVTMYLALLPFAIWCQTPTQFTNQQIRGTIYNNDLKPIEGVSVFASTPSGNQASRSSNKDGVFNLNISSQANEKIFIRLTYVGYITLFDTIQPHELQSYFRYVLAEDNTTLEAITITSSIIAGDDVPIASQRMNKQEIEKLNLGQDLPVLLNQSPSLVYTTDAGAGVGYTSLRIRGSDQTRINVTLNGIPLNDPESQGVFWVNMPDFASSANQIDIQRGVGTSTNGPGAFGANINIQTLEFSKLPSFEVNNSIGSFTTIKNSVLFNTGLINQNFKLTGRLSQISSNGYIDRASADLKSYYLAGSYQSNNKKFSADLVHFSGQERTYQAWYGTPESRVNGNVDEMEAYAERNFLSPEETENLLSSSRTYNYYTYENEVDNYQQDHYQLHLNYQINNNLKASLSGFYVKGAGYYEQYRNRQRFSSYGLPNQIVGDDTIQRTDLIRQRWLDNDYFGLVYALHYQSNNFKVQVGGNVNRYIGDHFGEIIWAEFAGNIPINTPYYFNQSIKDDASSFIKANVKFQSNVDAYLDLQLRAVNYQGLGIDQNRVDLDFNNTFLFFNPKAGINYRINRASRAYLSGAIANREPVRRDFVDAVPGETPLPEQMINIETGYQIKMKKLHFDVNVYLMQYYNQLVLTGEINDVGGFVRRNVGESYRAGIETQVAYKLLDFLEIGANLTLSRNRIESYTEVVYDWFEVIEPVEFVYNNTPIAFSPDVISAVFLDFKLNKDIHVSLINKYVGKQYLDNTGRESAVLNDYYTLDTRVSYKLPVKKTDANLVLLVNNLTNTLYASNGYTYKYFQGDNNMYTERMLYPQAGTNFLLALNVRF